MATVAGKLGHTSTNYVMKTYQRYQECKGRGAIQNLPMIEPSQKTEVITVKFR